MKISSIDRETGEVTVVFDTGDNALIFSEIPANDADSTSVSHSCVVLSPKLIAQAAEEDYIKAVSNVVVLPNVDMSVDSFRESISELGLVCFACGLLSHKPEFRRAVNYYLFKYLEFLEVNEDDQTAVSVYNTENSPNDVLECIYKINSVVQNTPPIRLDPSFLDKKPKQT